MGCSSDSNCTAEIAAALGVDAIVLGTVARADRSLQLSLRVVGAQSGALLASHASSADDDEALMGRLETAAPELAGTAAQALSRSLRQASQRPGRGLTVATAVVGGVAVLGGGGLLLAARDRYQRIPSAERGDAPAPAEEVHQWAQQGSTFQAAGWVALGVGAAALATSAVMWWWPSSEVPQLGVTMHPQATGLWVRGTFP